MDKVNVHKKIMSLDRKDYFQAILNGKVVDVIENENNELRIEEFLFAANQMAVYLTININKERVNNYFKWMYENAKDEDYQALLNPLKLLVRNVGIDNGPLILKNEYWCKVADKMIEKTDILNPNHYDIHFY